MAIVIDNPTTEARLLALAKERGIPPAEVVAEALEALFAEDAALAPLDDAARQGLLQAGEDIKAGRVTSANAVFARQLSTAA